jgi:hypothetical protein
MFFFAKQMELAMSRQNGFLQPFGFGQNALIRTSLFFVASQENNQNNSSYVLGKVSKNRIQGQSWNGRELLFGGEGRAPFDPWISEWENPALLGHRPTNP